MDISCCGDAIGGTDGTGSCKIGCMGRVAVSMGPGILEVALGRLWVVSGAADEMAHSLSPTLIASH